MNFEGISSAICIGAAKAGTSWLHACLEEHPEVSVPARGELDYFSWNFYKGQGWFFSQFILEKNNRFYIDISPSYLSSPEAPLRIFNLEPMTKIILIVRNPIHRAYSHYCMLLRGGIIGENIDEEIFKYDRIIQDGKYYKNLRQYRELFGPENIYVGFFDDLSSES